MGIASFWEHQTGAADTKVPSMPPAFWLTQQVEEGKRRQMRQLGAGVQRSWRADLGTMAGELSTLGRPIAKGYIIGSELRDT